MSNTTIEIPDYLMRECQHFEHYIVNNCPKCGGVGYVLTAEGKIFAKLLAQLALKESDK